MSLIHGRDSSDNLVPLLVDASGRVILAAGSNEIGLVQARSYGWVAGAWQKNPFQLEYSGTQTQEVLNLNADAGNNVLLSATVPAGEVWRVQAISAHNDTSAVSRIILYCSIAGIDVRLEEVGALAAGIAGTWTGEILLTVGNRIVAVFVGCTAGDDIYLRYHAVRADIDQ